MLREVLPRLFFYFFVIFPSTVSKVGAHVLEDCLEFDLAEIEKYLTTVRFDNTPTIEMMTGGFECPIETLPFGALKSDWARLILLQKAQPRESTLREKFSQIFRILVVAYFQMEEKLRAKEPNFFTTSSTDELSTRERIASFDLQTNTKGIDIAELEKTKETLGDTFSTVLPKEELFTSTKMTEIMHTAWKVTRENDKSGRIRGDLPVNTVTSPTEIDSQQKNTIKYFATTSTENYALLNVSTEAGKYTEMFDKYTNQDQLISSTNIPNSTTPDSATNNRDSLLQTELDFTVSNFVENRSTATNFIQNRTDGNTRNFYNQSEITSTEESTTNFVKIKINETISSEEDSITNINNKIETTKGSLIENQTVNYFLEHKMLTTEDSISTIDGRSKDVKTFTLESTTVSYILDKLTIAVENTTDSNEFHNSSISSMLESTVLTDSDSNSASMSLITASPRTTEINETSSTTFVSVTKSENIPYNFETINNESSTPLSVSTYFESETVRSTFFIPITEAVENQSKKMSDTSVPYASSNFDDEEENVVGKGTKLEFATVQYYNTGSIFKESENSPANSEVNQDRSTTEKTAIYSKESFENNIVRSGEDFNQNYLDHGRNSIAQIFKYNSIPWNSTFPRNKIRKPPILKKVPTGNEFWKYIAMSSRVPLPIATTSRSTMVSDGPGASIKSRKRGSLNTNVEKNFRWFYNFGRENSSDDQIRSQGIKIECNERKHDNVE